MARWIHIAKPFNFHWPNRQAVTHFSADHLGDKFVKDEVADFAIAKGYATEGKADASSRSSKGKSARKGKPAAKAADSGSDDAMAQPDMAVPDRPAGGDVVDPSAG